MTRDYVLVTAARNEEDLIEATVKSVAGQTILPKKWIIISDGSTDRTDSIVSALAREFPFLELIRNEARDSRNFGAKARAFRLGYDRLGEISHDFIGNLDADVTL